MQLYLDCDGVLADFERGAQAVLGMSCRHYEKRYGLAAFWRELSRHEDFYGSLPLMADAMELFEGVRHLAPVILTGLPRGNWAAAQKLRWAARHFPGTRIITCMAVDKRRHAQAGDILVDDTLRYRHLWEEAGGIFVHHLNARATLQALSEIAPAAMRAGGRHRAAPFSEGAGND